MNIFTKMWKPNIKYQSSIKSTIGFVRKLRWQFFGFSGTLIFLRWNFIPYKCWQKVEVFWTTYYTPQRSLWTLSLTNINEPVCCIQNEKRTHGECFINCYIPPTTAKSLDIFSSTLSTHFVSVSPLFVNIRMWSVCVLLHFGSTLGCKMFGSFWSVWSKMALAEVGVSLPWWCHALVLLAPSYWSLF